MISAGYEDGNDASNLRGDPMFDAVHGGQQLQLFNAHYDEYGFQPIVVFDGEGRFITTVLRPAKRPGGKEIRAFLRRLLRAIRANWPNTQILLRADSHYCCPEVLDWCRANGLDYILGVAPTTTLRRHVEGIEASTKTRFEAAPKEDGKLYHASSPDRRGAAPLTLEPVPSTRKHSPPALWPDAGKDAARLRLNEIR